MHDDVWKRVQRILSRQYRIRPRLLTDATDFVMDLGGEMDDAWEVGMAFEDRFEHEDGSPLVIEPEDAAQTFVSPDAIRKYLDERHVRLKQPRLQAA